MFFVFLNPDRQKPWDLMLFRCFTGLSTSESGCQRRVDQKKNNTFPSWVVLIWNHGWFSMVYLILFVFCRFQDTKGSKPMILPQAARFPMVQDFPHLQNASIQHVRVAGCVFQFDGCLLAVKQRVLEFGSSEGSSWPIKMENRPKCDAKWGNQQTSVSSHTQKICEKSFCIPHPESFLVSPRDAPPHHVGSTRQCTGASQRIQWAGSGAETPTPNVGKHKESFMVSGCSSNLKLIFFWSSLLWLNHVEQCWTMLNTYQTTSFRNNIPAFLSQKTNNSLHFHHQMMSYMSSKHI